MGVHGWVIVGSHEGGILSRGWLWKWKPPDDPSISDAVVNYVI